MFKKLTGIMVAGFVSSFAMASDGYFTCTQYTFSSHPLSLSDTSAFINSSATKQTIKYYSKIAFSDGDPDPGSTGGKFKTTSFPGNPTSKAEWFGMTATGLFEIPEAGEWTIACGSDDGFRVKIEGNGFSGSFEFYPERSYDISLKTFNFPVAGIYSLDLLYFEQGGYACCELSMAKGAHSSFSTSTFNL